MTHRDDERRREPPAQKPDLELDAAELRRRGLLAPGSRTRGVISWRGPRGDTVASVSYEADMADAARPWVRLRFTAPAPGGGRRPVEQLFALAATRAGRGGTRLWFVDGGRRVPQLHLPPGGEEFRSG